MSRTDRLMMSGSFGLASSIVLGWHPPEVPHTRSTIGEGIVSAAFCLLVTLIGAETLLRALVGSIGAMIAFSPSQRSDSARMPDLIAPGLVAFDLSNPSRVQSVMAAVTGEELPGALTPFPCNPWGSSLRRSPSGRNGLLHLEYGAEIVHSGCRRVMW